MVSNTELETPINDFQQLMAITAEECGELVQVCMKIMRKYNNLEDAKNDKYIQMLLEEAGDVLCIMELLTDHAILDWREIESRANVKREKLKQWSTLVK